MSEFIFKVSFMYRSKMPPEYIWNVDYFGFNISSSFVMCKTDIHKFINLEPGRKLNE